MRLLVWLCAMVASGGVAGAGLTQPATDTSAMADTATGFYTAYRSLPSGGIPDANARARLEPFLSPALDALLAESEAVQAHYAKATKNMSPPLIEGDVFTSLFEGATTFRIGTCETDSTGGRCTVALGYESGKDKPLTWTDTVRLVRKGAGWGVDDIVYGGGWAFGNKGRLTTMLKEAIADGKDMAD